MNMYETGETMKILGKMFVSHNPQIKEVVDAHALEAREKNKPVDVFGLAMDLYNLGLVNGIRKERQRRRRP